MHVLYVTEAGRKVIAVIFAPWELRTSFFRILHAPCELLLGASSAMILQSLWSFASCEQACSWFCCATWLQLTVSPLPVVQRFRFGWLLPHLCLGFLPPDFLALSMVLIERMWKVERGWRRPWGHAWSGDPSSSWSEENPSVSAWA